MKESACYLFPQMNPAWGACTNLYWGATYHDRDMPDVLRFIFHSNYLIKTNKISMSRLGLLPGIGPTIAQRIIDARPFYSKSSLKNVKGIGDKRYAGIKDRINIKLVKDEKKTK